MAGVEACPPVYQRSPGYCRWRTIDKTDAGMATGDCCSECRADGCEYHRKNYYLEPQPPCGCFDFGVPALAVRGEWQESKLVRQSISARPVIAAGEPLIKQTKYNVTRPDTFALFLI
jgi:hypothetical protein